MELSVSGWQLNENKLKENEKKTSSNTKSTLVKSAMYCNLATICLKKVLFYLFFSFLLSLMV